MTQRAEQLLDPGICRCIILDACNYARRLKTLRGLTPCEYICKCWTGELQRFTLNLDQKMPGSNTWPGCAAAAGLRPRGAAPKATPSF